MSKKEKLTAKLKSSPKDFTFDEAKTLMGLYGYTMSNSGKTSGSRIRFEKGQQVLYLHKPHPRKELKEYQIKRVIEILEKEKLI
jgi:hypothetical protein